MRGLYGPDRIDHLQWLKMTQRIEYKLLPKSSQPSNFNMCITSSLFNLLTALALHLWSLSLDHQHHPRYVYILTDRSSPPASFQSLCLYDLPVLAPIPHLFTLSIQSTHHSPSITPSLFHSRLKAFVFSFFITLFFLVSCGRLSWLFVSWVHVNIVYRQ